MSSLISEALKETIFQEFVQTAEKRAALVQATFEPADAMIRLDGYRPDGDVRESLRSANELVKDMLRVKSALKGDEKADMTRFLGLLSELQSLRDRLMSQVKP